MNASYRRASTLVFFLGLVSLTASVLFADKSSSSESGAKQAASEAEVDSGLLFRYVATLASDEFEGRNPAGKGGALAARYLKTKFKQFGLKPGGEQGTYFQPFMASQWRGVSIIRKPPPPVSGDASNPPASSAGVASSRPRKTEEEGKAGTQVDDLPDLPEVEVKERKAEQKVSARKLAQQLEDLFGDGYNELDGLSPETIRHIEQWRETKYDPKPYHRAAYWAFHWIRDHAGVFGTSRDFQCRNVIALLPGTDTKLAKEFIVVTAHYDHEGVYLGEVYNGADDNASGTAAILELARVLKKLGTRRSILFIAFDGEEKILWGSRHWAKHPTVPLKQVVAQINIDMVGRIYENQLYLIGADSSKELTDLVTKEFGKEKLKLQNVDAIALADHWPLFRKRIPTVTFCNGLHYDYHLPTDDTEKINFADMELAVRAVLRSIQRLDSRAERVEFSVK